MRPHVLDLDGPPLEPQHLARGTDTVWLGKAPGGCCWCRAHTAEHVWTDVGRAPPLVLQEVPLAHEMLPEAEVGDGYPMRPGGREAESEQTSVSVPPAAPHFVPGQRNHTHVLFCSPDPPRLLQGCVGSATGGADTGQSPGLTPGELSPQGPESLCPGKLQGAPLSPGATA